MLQLALRIAPRCARLSDPAGNDDTHRLPLDGRCRLARCLAQRRVRQHRHPPSVERDACARKLELRTPLRWPTADGLRRQQLARALRPYTAQPPAPQRTGRPLALSLHACLRCFLGQRASAATCAAASGGGDDLPARSTAPSSARMNPSPTALSPSRTSSVPTARPRAAGCLTGTRALSRHQRSGRRRPWQRRPLALLSTIASSAVDRGRAGACVFRARPTTRASLPSNNDLPSSRSSFAQPPPLPSPHVPHPVRAARRVVDALALRARQPDARVCRVARGPRPVRHPQEGCAARPPSDELISSADFGAPCCLARPRTAAREVHGAP